MQNIILSKQQQQAIDSIAAWYKAFSAKAKNPGQIPQSFLLSGAAGTGKTTIAGRVAEQMRLSSVFAAYTGKAARVMQSKGMLGASTCHKMLYAPIEEKESCTACGGNGCERCNFKGEVPTGRILSWRYNPSATALESDLIIIDEVSMLPDDMASDLARLGKPILVLGDVEGQLPPIEGQGAFVNRRPDFLLTEVHRFALTSPIAQLANIVRNVPNGRYTGWGFEDPGLIDEGLYIADPTLSLSTMVSLITRGQFQAICGYNRTRFTTTQACREAEALPANIPQPNEPIICLRNNYTYGVVNGDQLTFKEILRERDDERWICALDLEGREIIAEVYKHHFFNCYRSKPIDFKPKRSFARNAPRPLELDWAYCITCHKAQGSEYDNVLVLDDGFYGWQADNRRRWLYTAFTRAKRNLTITRFAKGDD